jgi:hypothetical protein
MRIVAQPNLSIPKVEEVMHGTYLAPAFEDDIVARLDERRPMLTSWSTDHVTQKRDTYHWISSCLPVPSYNAPLSGLDKRL